MNIFNGKAEYLVKWKGFDVSESTWEPEENLEYFSDLVQEYELKNKENAVSQNPNPKNTLTSGQMRGFDRGLIPEKILGKI